MGVSECLPSSQNQGCCLHKKHDNSAVCKLKLPGSELLTCMRAKMTACWNMLTELQLWSSASSDPGVMFRGIACMCASHLYPADFCLLSWFHGVVGYHTRLTRERSPVRSRMKPLAFAASEVLLDGRPSAPYACLPKYVNQHV